MYMCACVYLCPSLCIVCMCVCVCARACMHVNVCMCVYMRQLISTHQIRWVLYMEISILVICAEQICFVPTRACECVCVCV